MSKSASTPLNLKLTRTIHPVGQGAFYSETFSDCNNRPVFTAVYDCGGKKDYLKKEIETLSTVDILFISHFHSDHINGVQDLIDLKSVKRVVFPVISHIRYLIDFVFNFTKDESKDAADFMLKLLPMMRHARSGNSPFSSNGGVKYIPVIDSGPEGKEFPSYKPLWRYKVFYKYEEEDSKEIALLGLLSTIPDISEIIEDCSRDYQEVDAYLRIAELLKENKDLLEIIKKAYSKVYKGDHNSYSMLVFSYQITSEEERKKEFDCLYTGDAVVNKWTQDIVSQCIPDYFQVPHHGSNHNHSRLYYRNRPIAFISAGIKNRYHHPGLITLTYILKACKEINVITEDVDTAFIRCILFQ